MPALSGVDATGRRIALSDLGERVWLILSRFAACPFCSLRLAKISRRHDELVGAGVKVLVVFPSSQEQMERYVAAYSPPFVVMADPEEKWFDAFSVQNSWIGEAKSALNVVRVAQAMSQTKMNPLKIDAAVHQMPADFLIRAGVRIDKVCYGRQLDDGFAIDEVLDWALGRKSEVPPSR